MGTAPMETLSSASGRRRVKPTTAAVAVLAALLLAGGGLVVHLGLDGRLPGLPGYPKRFAVVEEGVLYRSAQPTPRHLRNLVRDKGLRTVLIVREGESERVLEEKAAAERLGLKVIHLHLPSRQRVSDEHLAAFFECVDQPANHPVLVHCSAGRHRTGYLCARYRIDRQGWTVDRAIEEMLSFGCDFEDHAMILDQLRSYRPAAPAAGSPPAEIR